MLPSSRILEAYRGKHVLVTGAGGYLGLALVDVLGSAKCHLTVLVRQGKRTLLSSLVEKSAIRIVEGDVSNAQGWEHWLAGQDIVFQLAGQTSHHRADEDPEADWKVNVLPIVRMMAACLRTKVKPRIVFASTASVVGLCKTFPIGELVPPNPYSIYDVHKLSAEHYLSYYANTQAIPTCSLRIANVYGPSRASSNRDRGILNAMARDAVAGKTLRIFGTGEWLRDYIHISDVISAFLSVGCAQEERVAGKVFNIATGVGTPFQKAVQTVAEEAGELLRTKVSVLKEPKKIVSSIETRSYVGDPSGMRISTGWLPTIGIQEGIRDLVRWAFATQAASSDRLSA